MRLSEAIHQITDADTEGFGNARQRFHCNLVFGPLNVSDVIPRQVRFFRKLFLAQTSLDPSGADGFTEDFGCFVFSALPHNDNSKAGISTGLLPSILGILFLG
jgi:hypothetical protein